MQFSDMSTVGDAERQPYYLPRVEEEVEITDSMAVISVPPPRFRPGEPAYILHDFNRVSEGYNSCTEGLWMHFAICSDVCVCAFV